MIVFNLIKTLWFIYKSKKYPIYNIPIVYSIEFNKTAINFQHFLNSSGGESQLKLEDGSD